MKRILLTGATGFVGANLARRLLRDGHEAHLLIRPSARTWRIEEIRPHVRLYEAPLEDAVAVAAAVHRIRPEWVFHLAAHGAYSSQTDVRRIVQTNILGTVNLVESCLQSGSEAFVNTGSSSEYGFKDHAPAETEWLEPNSHYAVSKASATLYCRHTAQSRRVHMPTLRLYSVYGPWEEPTRLIPTLLVRGLDGRLPPLANPDTARDFVYSEDVTDAYLLAATVPNQEPGAVYNVGTGVQTTLRDVVATARRVLGVTPEPQWGSMADRSWDTQVWVADSRKICRELGWQPRHDLAEGLRLTAEWLRERRALRNWCRDVIER